MGSKRKSMIIYGAERMAEALRKLFAKSVLIGWMSTAYSRLEKRYRSGWFRSVSDVERDRNAWQYRLRRFWMKGMENSLFLRACHDISNFLLESSVSSFGSFAFLYGVFSASSWFMTDPAGQKLSTLIVSALFILLSVPILHSGKSLAYAIGHSFFAGTFLFDFCGISEEHFELPERGKERPWQALIAALLLAFAGRIFTPLLFLALVFFSVFLYLLFSVPELGVCLILLLLPFLNLSEHPTWILLGLVLTVDVAWLRMALCGRRHFRFGAIDLTVMLFGVLYLAGGFISAGGRASLQAGVVMALLLSLWFPTVGLLSAPRWRMRAVGALRISSFVCALWGIVQYFFTDLELRWVDTERFADIGGRVTSFFSNPNVLAVFLLLMAPLSLAGIFEERSSAVNRLLNGVAFVATVFCLILTWSRGAWLGILLAVLLFFLLHSKRSLGLLLLSAVPLLCVLPALPRSILNRFSSIGSFSESSIRYRLYTWRGVVRMFRAYPFGIGAGSEAFMTVYPQYAVSGTETVMHTHNLFLKILTEIGIPGFLTFCFFGVLLLFCALKNLREPTDKGRTVAFGCACGIVGVLVMGMFDDIWYHYGLFCLFWVICAMSTLSEEKRYGEVELWDW